MYENVNEPIEAIAVFKKGYQQVKPFKFFWGTREFIISELGYKHKERDGKKIIHVFSATDGISFFEIRFDPEELKWMLARIWDGETT